MGERTNWNLHNTNHRHTDVVLPIFPSSFQLSTVPFHAFLVFPLRVSGAMCTA
ncbi:hypothetical protein K443DRAFT_283429 [Laccaria amethystina LaAM-08-1]|uniref:Unplaced genomic scaffold K443scaffold_184, whole genome shotgun sequence n=1 Tax=Laccaria amethystina LaAM-08-1 TaxID=1095629 RepID=A0A0C9WVK9_9AGAR|nr:hypothetical protein K443DRAFT_283429 [Laccaria amethystina LaAM-08-1]